MKVVLAYLLNTLVNVVVGLLVARFLGPAEFGRFAVALAAASVAQSLLFDWLRYAAARFYSERARLQHPRLRATLETSFALVAAALGGLAILALALGATLGLSAELVGIAAATAAVNGLFDYRTALVRARFEDGLYARLVVTKNALAFAFTAGGAFWFGSAAVAVAGVGLSMAGALLSSARSLADRSQDPARADHRLAMQCLRYAAPIVAANALYLAIPLANRALAARWYGFSEAGQFSLAFDIGTRLIAAIGTALDVLLFQIAVRADELHGGAQAQRQVARNMTIVFAILTPTCLGAYVVLPSLEQILAPPAFRGPFAHYLAMLLPGLFCWGLLVFGLNPVFQIARRTAPLIAAAAIACATDAVLLVTLSDTGHADVLARAQAGSFMGGLAALAILAALRGTRWPPLSDLLRVLIAAGAMLGALWPMRQWLPGPLAAAAQITTGALVYAAAVAALDIAGLRTAVIDLWRARKRAAG